MARRIRIQSIPEQYQDGFIAIRDLPDQAIQQLLSALDTAPLLVSSDALSERLVEDVEAISRGGISSILASLLSVYSLRQEFDISVSELAEHLAQAMQEGGPETLRFTDGEQRGQFEHRLVALLTSSSLDLIGKASELTTEQERFMREARIITDIRPIFEDDSVDRPSGAVITHTLKISYWDDSNQNRDFYMALDAVDVRNLRASLERAEAKARSLRSILDQAEVPLVEID
jgi:hypothetical protein